MPSSGSDDIANFSSCCSDDHKEVEFKLKHGGESRSGCFTCKQEGRKDGTCLSPVLTYDVCAEGSEGMSPAHVQMGRVEPLQETDVIKTLRLQNVDKALLCGSGNTEWQEEKALRKNHELDAHLIIFSLAQTLVFLLWGGLPLNLAQAT